MTKTLTVHVHTCLSDQEQLGLQILEDLVLTHGKKINIATNCDDLRKAQELSKDAYTKLQSILEAANSYLVLCCDVTRKEYWVDPTTVFADNLDREKKALEKITEKNEHVLVYCPSQGTYIQQMADAAQGVGFSHMLRPIIRSMLPFSEQIFLTLVPQTPLNTKKGNHRYTTLDQLPALERKGLLYGPQGFLDDECTSLGMVSNEESLRSKLLRKIFWGISKPLNPHTTLS